MLCSMPTGKSGSKWLDRLRSSKGFPANNDLDLEQFLNHHNPNPNPDPDPDPDPDPNLSNSPHTNLSDPNIGLKSNPISTEPIEKPVLDRNQTSEPPQWIGIVSNVLAELFNMGDSNDFHRIHGRKSSRKQSNPKICVLSISKNVENESDVNSCVEAKQTREENVEEDERCNGDLSAFSRTEVTVIDTSYGVWKCEKLLFRRKNVWRVREKKSKATRIGVKKRKASVLGDESGGGEKKLKEFSSLKDANGVQEHCTMLSNEGHLQSDETNEDPKETPDILRQVPEKRFPRKLKKGGSSVVLIKSIPSAASKKNGANIPKSCLKLTQ